jgi:hypothetical protein
VGPQRGRLGQEGDRDGRAVADQVLGAVGAAQDEELWMAGDGAAPEDLCPGVRDHLGADPAGQLLPEHGGAELGPDRGHGLLFGLLAQALLELRLELVEHPPHRR